MNSDGLFFKNLYSEHEVYKIFMACKTFDECEQIVNEFSWLIKEGFQMKSDHLRRVSNARLNQLIRRL